MAIQEKPYPRSRRGRKAYTDALEALYGCGTADPSPGMGQSLKTPPGASMEAREVPRGTSRKRTVAPAHPPEWREQAALVKWCMSHPALRGHVINIRNEGRRTAAQANVARMMGLRKGAFDLFLARPAMGSHGLFLDVKQAREYTPSETRTPTWLAQVEFQATMRGAGYGAEFAYGAEHGRILVLEYMGMQAGGRHG